MKRKFLLVGALGALLLAALAPWSAARAGDVSIRVNTPEFGFRIGAPHRPHYPVYAPAPYYTPPPVVYVPPPRYIPPPHVVYGYPYYNVGGYYGHRYPHWRHHGHRHHRHHHHHGHRHDHDRDDYRRHDYRHWR